MSEYLVTQSEIARLVEELAAAEDKLRRIAEATINVDPYDRDGEAYVLGKILEIIEETP